MEETIEELKERINVLEVENENLKEELDNFKHWSEEAFDALRKLW